MYFCHLINTPTSNIRPGIVFGQCRFKLAKTDEYVARFVPLIYSLEAQFLEKFSALIRTFRFMNSRVRVKSVMQISEIQSTNIHGPKKIHMKLQIA